MLSLSLKVRVSLIIPSILFTFPTTMSTCWLNLRRWSTMTPRSLSQEDSSRQTIFPFGCDMTYWKNGGFDPSLSTLHLVLLKRRSQVFYQSWSSVRSCCSMVQSCKLLIFIKILVLSANSLIRTTILSGRSFINIKKSSGPSTMPCGIPLVTALYVDFLPFTITL